MWELKSGVECKDQRVHLGGRKYCSSDFAHQGTSNILSFLPVMFSNRRLCEILILKE